MKWRRILLLSLLFVLALGGATWAVLQRSDAATAIVRRELAARLIPEVALAATELDLSRGRLTLRGLRLDDPTRVGQPLVQIARADLDIDANPLGGSFWLHGAVLDGVAIDLGPKLPSLAQLARQQEPDAAGGPLPRIPPVTVRRATVRYTATAGAPPFVIEDLMLEVTPVRGSTNRLQITGTGSLAGIGAQLHITGDVDLEASTTKIAIALRAGAIDRAVIEFLGARLGLDVRTIDAAAQLEEIGLVYSARGTGSQATSELELGGHLTGVRISAPGFPPQVRKADVRLHATTRDQGQVTLHLTQSTEKGRLDVRAEVSPLWGTPGYTVRANGRDVSVDSDAIAGLAAFPLGKALGRALQPTAGRGDIDLYLRSPHLPTGTAEFDLTVRGVSMSYQGFGEGEDQLGFPLPLVDARGRVQMRDDIVWLEGLQASIDPAAGGGSVELDGRIDTKAPNGEETTLDIRARDVHFNDHLRTGLDALLHDAGDLYDRLSPKGTAMVNVNVRPRQQLAGGWSVDVLPLAATMQWTPFPYRLDGLLGKVQVRATGAEFDLAGHHGDGKLKLRGRVPLGADGPDGVGDFAATFQLEKVAIDEDLRTAITVLAPPLDGPWRNSAPSGRFGGVVEVWRKRPDDPLQYDARLDLQAVDLVLPAAPWRATQLHGQVVAQGSGEQSRVDFGAVHGNLERGSGKPARLAMLGSIVRGAVATEDLAFVAREFELDAQVGKTLEQLDALGPGTWDNLRPSGRVDLVCKVQHAADQAPRVSLDVQLVDVSSDAAMLPMPAHHITGEIRVAGGELTIAGVRGELGSVIVHCSSGRVAVVEGRTHIAFEVAANGFPVDSGLANLFSGPLHRAILERQLSGRADIDSLSLVFKVPPAGSSRAFETEIEGQLRFYDVGMTLGTGAEGLRVDSINGVVSLDRSTVGEQQGGLSGTLRSGSLRIFDQPFEAIEAPFAADARRIELTALTSRFHGGQVSPIAPGQPAVHYLLPCPEAPAGRLSAHLAFDKADVVPFLTRCGWTNPPYKGAASGQVALERLDGNDLVNATGSGSLRVERGDLGSVPLFTAIYAQLPAPERPRFDKLDLQFRLADRRFTFDRLQLGSNLLAANGKGTLDLDGYLDVEMKLDNLLGPSADPLFMPLIRYLTQNIVTFHLFGHLRDLRAEKRWLGASSPGRQTILPMPPILARPTLPNY